MVGRRSFALHGWMAALGGLAGTAWQMGQSALLPAPDLLWLGAAAVPALIAARRWRHRAGASLLFGLAAALLAFTATSQRAAWRLADRLPAALAGRDLVVTGVIDELPRAGPDGARFVLATETARLGAAQVDVPARLALGWYRGPDEDALLGGPPEDLRAGQRWQLPVRLRPVHGTLNPGGFDTELWLFEQGIRASGGVRSRPGQPALKLAEREGRWIDRLRQSARDAIQRHVDDAAAAGVLAALAIGDQAAIERADWDLFRTTGVAHLMSISGLHVTMFAWLAGALVGRLWRWSPRAMLALPAPQAARWGGVLAATAYALVSGWGVPAQRTVWMLALVALMRGGTLRWPLPTVLLAAAFGVVVVDPWALLQAGFWLSFVAVALLVASDPVQRGREPVHGWRQRAWHAVRDGLRSQAVATVGLAPLSLVFFQQVALVGFAANLVAIPLVSLLVAPLALLGLLLPPMWLAAAALVQLLGSYLQWLAAFPMALWSAPAAPPWAVACGLCAGLLAVAPLPWRLRWLSLPLALPLLAPPVARPPVGSFELVAADIGQGTSVLVRTRSHLLVYDAGPQISRDADAGSRVLLPLLRQRGETRIDLLMLSHRDTDHVGGAAALIAGIPVARMSSSLEDGHRLLALGVPHRRCEAGQRWDWDGVQFEVLHPLADDHGRGLKPNALSCVLRVQSMATSVLLTGDIEAPQELALRARSPAALPSDVLLVPHHGSRTSSTAGFIEAVHPRVAVVQAGYRSRYGHPAPDIEARYLSRAITIERSDRCGAWSLPADGAAVCERRIARRYWHDQEPAERLRP